MALIAEQPLAGLMLVVTIGFVLGRVRMWGIDAGPAGGTVVVALAFGAAGLSLEELYGESVPPITIGLFGFSLFIYAIGFEAGPRFFRALRGGAGVRFVVVAFAINALAVALTVAFARALELDSATAAGMLAGALTSAPTYAAASELTDASAALAVSFALTFPVGLIAAVVAIQIVPRLLRDPITPGRAAPERLALTTEKGSPELSRVFEVEKRELCGPTLGELDLTHRTGCVIRRLRRENHLEIPDADTTLQYGDHVLATGRIDELHRFEEVVGPEIYDGRIDADLPERRIVVASKHVVGKTLAELDLIRRHKIVIASIERSHTIVEPTAEEVLERDDVVVATGNAARLATAADELGWFEPSATHTNIAMYAGGIFVGLLLGTLKVSLFGVELSLGLAGGLLLVGVVVGRFRRVGPLSANVPASARQLVRDLGILLFVGEAGIDAGHQLGQAGLDIPVGTVVAASAAIVLIPLVVVFAIARRGFRMSSADTWGSLAGGMTSSAALVTVKRVAGSNDPAASYAATFAVASVLATLAGQVAMLLL